ncbi:MAG: hypothetical protein ABJE95_02365 [Byssovorax sp.]
MSFLPRFKSRKLLIASIGVATASYVGCGETNTGNLIAPPCEQDGGCNAGGGSPGATGSTTSSGTSGAGGTGGVGPMDAGPDADGG